MNFFIPVHAGNGVLHSTRIRERVSTYSSDSNRGNHGIYNISICCRYIQQASCVIKSMLCAILLIDGSYVFLIRSGMFMAFSRLLWFRVKSNK